MIIYMHLILLLSALFMNAMDKSIDEQELVRDEIAQEAKELRIWSPEEIKELETKRVYLEEKQARIRFDLQSANPPFSKWDLSASLSLIVSSQRRMKAELCGLLAGNEGIINDEYKQELRCILKRLDDDLNRANNIG